MLEFSCHDCKYYILQMWKTTTLTSSPLPPSFPDMDVGGCHLFNFATLHVLIFVAIKERAYNLALAFLQSPVVSPVFQHCKHELVPFIEFIQTRDSTAPALQMCKE